MGIEAIRYPFFLKNINIDSKRGIVIIRQSKGKKDRMAPLSPKIVKMLREYFWAIKPNMNYLKAKMKIQNMMNAVSMQDI